MTPVSVVRQGLLLSSACVGWDDDDDRGNNPCVSSETGVITVVSVCRVG